MRIKLIVPLLLSCLSGFSQNPYYDAIELKSYLSNGKLPLPTKNCKEDPNDLGCVVMESYMEIIRNYIAPELGEKDNDVLIRDHLKKTTSPNYNPFLISVLPDFPQGASDFFATDKSAKSLGKFSKEIGGLNVTTIADGLAQFLIERANEEINVWFFQKFKEDLSKSIELQVLFPTTTEYIRITEPYQYAQMLNLLREAFRKDLNDLIDNLEDLASLNKYQELIKKHDALKIVVLGLAGASIASKLKNGIHPADVIDSLGQKKYIGAAGNNLYSGIRLLSVLSQSVRDTTQDKAYVSADSFKNKILHDPVVFQIYLGLLYQQLSEIHFFYAQASGSKDSISVQEFLRNNKESILNAQDFGLRIVEKLKKTEADFNRLKNRSDTSNLKYTYYYDFYNSVINLIETGLDAGQYFPKGMINIPNNKKQEIKKFIYVARKGNDIYKNVSEKNYSLAILNFSVVYDTLFKKYKARIEEFNSSLDDKFKQISKAEKILELIKSRNPEDFLIENDNNGVKINGQLVSSKKALKNFYGTRCVNKAIAIYTDYLSINRITGTKFIKYASFMAAVTESDSPEDVKAALNAAALPAGSASIKRQTPFNISINAYLGLHAGNEYLEEGTFGSKPGWGKIRGVSAPIGIAFSKGLGRIGSMSLFASLIDVGAVASFRIKDDSTEQLPAIELENIFAPGLHLVYGFPKTPISIGYGWQRGPQLRTVNVEDQNNPGQFNNELLNGYRWAFFVAVDIPLFNLYTKTR